MNVLIQINSYKYNLLFCYMSVKYIINQYKFWLHYNFDFTQADLKSDWILISTVTYIFIKLKYFSLKNKALIYFESQFSVCYDSLFKVLTINKQIYALPYASNSLYFFHYLGIIQSEKLLHPHIDPLISSSTGSLDNKGWDRA